MHERLTSNDPPTAGSKHFMEIQFPEPIILNRVIGQFIFCKNVSPSI